MSNVWSRARLRVLLTGFVVLVTLANPETASAQVGRTRVYATFVSHNDESTTNVPCAWVSNDRDRYVANRAAIVELAQTIVERGAAWDFQSDWEYLDRVGRWDDEASTATTDGKTIVKYLAELSPAHLAVDAHSHEKSGYNYADVVQMLSDLGVPSTGVLGGFIATPASSESWTRFRNGPLRGLRSPFLLWSPSVLWGGASGQHRDDPQASGVWRPKDAERFFEDDPSQSLPNIGGYTSDRVSGDGVAELLRLLRTGRLEEGHLYTATIMLDQCNLDADRTILTTVRDIIDGFAPDVATGDLVWATLPEVLRVWREEYGSTATVYQKVP